MSRNRITYQSEAIYVSKCASSVSQDDHNQLHRVINANYGFILPREDINQYGYISRIDTLVVDAPIVSFDFSYYITDGLNESNMGFYVQSERSVYTGIDGLETTKDLGNLSGYILSAEGNFLSGHIISNNGRNFFIATSDESTDLNQENILNKNIIGIGNSIITSYKLDAKVGDFPTINVTSEGLNINSAQYKSYKTSNITFENGYPTPEVDVKNNKLLANDGDIYKIIKLPNPSSNTGETIIKALKPSDILLTFNEFTENSRGFKPISNLDSIHIQSISLDISLNRSSVLELGKKYPYIKAIEFPIIASLNIGAIVSENQLKNIAECIDDSKLRSMTLSIKNPNDDSKLAVKYELRGFYLKSESFISNIGQNKNVDLVFQAEVASANDLNNGIFISSSAQVTTQIEQQYDVLFFNAEDGNDWNNRRNWFIDLSLTSNIQSMPTYAFNACMKGSIPAYLNLDDISINPIFINTTLVSDLHGICVYSNTNKNFSSNVLGNISFYGNVNLGT